MSSVVRRDWAFELSPTSHKNSRHALSPPHPGDLPGPGRRWEPKPPADGDEIAGLRELAPFELPPEYVELLRYGDGGFGGLNAAPLLFRMDCITESVVRNEMWRRDGQFGGSWFIGGKGGME